MRDGSAHLQLKEVYGLGSLSYWKNNSVEFPSQNERVCVCVVSDGLDADPNCTNGIFVCTYATEGVEFIQLRDYDTYIPLWRGCPGR